MSKKNNLPANYLQLYSDDLLFYTQMVEMFEEWHRRGRPTPEGTANARRGPLPYTPNAINFNIKGYLAWFNNHY